MKEKKKEVYEAPVIEVIEFEFEDSIAVSSNSSSSTICGGEEGGLW